MNVTNEMHPLLKRAVISLECEDWDVSIECCNRYLDEDPCNSYAYLLKLMAEVRVSVEDDLAYTDTNLSEYSSYKNAIRFADSDLKNRLEGYALSVEKLMNIKKEEAKEKEVIASNVRLQRKKEMQSSLIKLLSILAAIILIIIGIRVCTNGVRANKIEKELLGKKFTTNYINVKTNPYFSYDGETSEHIIERYSYEFVRDGYVIFTDTLYFYDEIVSGADGIQWDDVKTETEIIKEFDIKISIFGDVSVIIGDKRYPVEMKNNNLPDNFGVGTVFYCDSN